MDVISGKVENAGEPSLKFGRLAQKWCLGGFVLSGVPQDGFQSWKNRSINNGCGWGVFYCQVALLEWTWA